MTAMQHGGLINLAKDHDRTLRCGGITELSHATGEKRGRKVATSWKGTADNGTTFDTNDEDYQMLMSSWRWQEHAVPTAVAGLFIILANLYGNPAAGSCTKAYAQN